MSLIMSHMALCSFASDIKILVGEWWVRSSAGLNSSGLTAGNLSWPLFFSALTHQQAV